MSDGKGEATSIAKNVHKRMKATPPYELSIRPGERHTVSNGDGIEENLVVLASGTQYEIGLKNNTSKRANAKVGRQAGRHLYSIR